MYQSFETLTPTCCTNQSPVCVESAVTAFLKSPRQTLKSISKQREHGRELRKYFMSNVQITKQRENTTADKSNVTPLIPQAVGQRSESEHSPSLPGKAGEYEVIVPASPHPSPYAQGLQGGEAGVSNDWCIRCKV